MSFFLINEFLVSKQEYSKNGFLIRQYGIACSLGVRVHRGKNRFFIFFFLKFGNFGRLFGQKKKVHVVTNDLVILLTRNLVDFITKAMYVVLF